MPFSPIGARFSVSAAMAVVALIPIPTYSNEPNASRAIPTATATAKHGTREQINPPAFDAGSNSLVESEKIVDDVEAHREQQLAVLEIQKLGGKVYYDYQRDPKRRDVIVPKATPKDPKRLSWVIYVSLRDTKVSNEDLRHLRKFPRLQTLDLANTSITSRGMLHLKTAKHLSCLSLWNTKVGDEGLRFLRDKQDLFNLVLDGTKITDAGLEHLSELTNLEEWLGLVDTEVSDHGLKHLKALKKLRILNLRRTRVTAAGVRDLKASLPITNISQGP